MGTSIVTFILGAAVGSGIMYYICKSSTRSVDITQKLIPNSEAISLLSNRSRSATETASGHLPLEVLVTYFDYISRACQDKSITLSGFEFYFGKYGQRDDERESNKMTFFLYPTVNISGADVPFDPFASTSTNIVRFVELMGNGENGTNLVALNRSNMSPPRGNTIVAF